jgi:anti-anti-sigma factor
MQALLMSSVESAEKSYTGYNGNCTPLSQASRWHCLRSELAPQRVSSRMHRDDDRSDLNHRGRYVNSPFTVIRGSCSNHRGVLHLNGPLHTPVNGELRQNVRALLRHDVRVIELDLGGVPRIDAAGVGELVRAFNAATASGRVLKVVDATPWVRDILERVGLFGILSEGGSLPITSLAQ